MFTKRSESEAVLFVVLSISLEHIALQSMAYL